MICILFSCGFLWYLLCQIGLAIQLDYFKAPMTLQVLHPTSWRNTVWLRPHPRVVSFVYQRGNNISLQYRIHSYMIFPSRFPFFTYIRPHFASKTSVQVAATQVCMPYWSITKFITLRYVTLHGLMYSIKMTIYETSTAFAKYSRCCAHFKLVTQRICNVTSTNFTNTFGTLL